MRIGTSHFVTKSAAIEYYGYYEKNPIAAVDIKLAEGSIHIGLPPYDKATQRLRLIDNHTRYQIEDL